MEWVSKVTKLDIIQVISHDLFILKRNISMVWI